MPFTPDEVNRSLTPTGNKFYPSFNVGGTEMPPGLLSMTPINPAPHQTPRPQRASPDARAKLADFGESASTTGPMARGRR